MMPQNVEIGSALTTMHFVAKGSRILLASMLFLALAGCGRNDDEIRVYQAPKEPVMASQAREATPQPSISWTTPKTWTQLPAQEMRFASFQVSPEHSDVVLTVIPLGSSPVIANLNRWEGQLGLPPTPEAEMSKKISRVKTEDGSEASMIDLSNDKQRMLAAMIPHDGQTWFFKLLGPFDVVGAEKQNFDSFIKSILFNDPNIPTTPEASIAQATPTSTGLQSWSVPKDWTEEPPKPMRAASFAVKGSEGETGEVIVTQMDASFFGSVLDNINRWRGQVGLERIKSEQDSKAQTIKAGGKELKLYDFVGPKKDDQPARRILVTTMINGPSIWFFKLQGPSTLLDQQKQAFLDFLSSVKFAQPK